MEGAFRNLITVLIMVGALMTGSMMFISGFLISNGAQLPPVINSTLTQQVSILNQLSTSVGNKIGITTTGTQSLLGGGQSPNVFSSIAATFAVFGGVIVAVFTFMAYLPASFLALVGIVGNPYLDPFAGIANIFIAITASIVALTIVWSIIRAVTKVDV